MYENIKKFIREEDAFRLLRMNDYILRVEDEDSFSIQDTFTGAFDEYNINSLYFMIYQLIYEIIKEAIVEHFWDIDPENKEYSPVETAMDIIANKEYEEFMEFISKIL